MVLADDREAASAACGEESARLMLYAARQGWAFDQGALPRHGNRSTC